VKTESLAEETSVRLFPASIFRQAMLIAVQDVTQFVSARLLPNLETVAHDCRFGRALQAHLQRTEIQSLLELAKSKEVIVKTIKRLDDLTGSDDTDISRIAQSIDARLDKATAATEVRPRGTDRLGSGAT
jgi:hypothetical protein